jgi:uncharacterized membrane protein
MLKTILVLLLLIILAGILAFYLPITEISETITYFIGIAKLNFFLKKYRIILSDS